MKRTVQRSNALITVAEEGNAMTRLGNVLARSLPMEMIVASLNAQRSAMVMVHAMPIKESASASKGTKKMIVRTKNAPTIACLLESVTLKLESANARIDLLGQIVAQNFAPRIVVVMGNAILKQEVVPASLHTMEKTVD